MHIVHKRRNKSQRFVNLIKKQPQKEAALIILTDKLKTINHPFQRDET